MPGFSDSTVTVYLTNSYGEQFSGNKEYPAGTTIGQLFEQATNSANPDLFMIRLNGAVDPSASTVLSTGDRITITPLQIKSA